MNADTLLENLAELAPEYRYELNTRHVNAPAPDGMRSRERAMHTLSIIGKVGVTSFRSDVLEDLWTRARLALGK